MSSTNHTTNYELPQFVGSDKPAWLGDINPAMNAIDTAMHANATTAAQGVSDAATAQARADSAYTKAGDAETAAGTAQTTANTAIANSNTNAGKIATLEAALNFNSINHISELPSASTGGWARGCDLTVAQNSDGSMFKFYGIYQPFNNTSGGVVVNRPQVTGLTGVYGIATGLYLNDAPTEAYVVSAAGLYFSAANASYIWNSNTWTSSFAVGTDGQIYISANPQASETIAGNQMKCYQFYSSIYLNKNFGDTPSQSA